MIQKNITNNNNLFQHHQARTRYSAPINPKLQQLPSPTTPQTFELLKTGYVLLYIYIDTGYTCSHHKRAGVNSLQYTNVHPRFGEECCGHVAILDWPTGLCGALWRHAVFVIIIIFQSSAFNSDKKKNKQKKLSAHWKITTTFFNHFFMTRGRRKSLDSMLYHWAKENLKVRLAINKFIWNTHFSSFVILLIVFILITCLLDIALIL